MTFITERTVPDYDAESKSDKIKIRIDFIGAPKGLEALKNGEIEIHDDDENRPTGASSHVFTGPFKVTRIRG
jgi:hypothetical protein